MKVEFDISRQVECNVCDESVKKALEKSLQKSKYGLQAKSVYVSIACVSEEEIQRLNGSYREKNAVTDVLSFPTYNSKEEVEQVKDDILDVGELIISPDFVARAAKEDEVSFEREFIFVLSHGFLHLLGFDHGEEMFSIQDDVCDKLT